MILCYIQLKPFIYNGFRVLNILALINLFLDPKINQKSNFIPSKLG